MDNPNIEANKGDILYVVNNKNKPGRRFYKSCISVLEQ